MNESIAAIEFLKWLLAEQCEAICLAYEDPFKKDFYNQKKADFQWAQINFERIMNKHGIIINEK